MGKYFVLLLVLLVSACGCPVDVGDIVVDESSGNIGVVKSIKAYGSKTENCMCAVFYEDGTWSKNNTIITGDLLSTVDARYVYSWNYRKVNE